MALSCPNCQVLVPLVLRRSSGRIYTSRGIAIRGTIDERTGLTTPSTLYYEVSAYFDLQGFHYSIGECTNCHEEIVIENNSGKPIWPLSEVTVAEEIPERIAKVFAEAKKAHAVGAETAALLAARTALTRMLREQCCSQYTDLVEQGRLTPLLADQANEIRLWANMTGHEDVPSDMPKSEDVEELLNYLDLVFETLYVQPAKLKSLQDKRKNVK